MNLAKWNLHHPVRQWDPFKEMEEMQERMARVFDLAPLCPEAGRELMSARDWAPLVDISEDDQEYLIKAELPEVKKEDVRVSVENGVLNITGERKHEAESQTKKQHRLERGYGRFVRGFTLPDDVNPAQVAAEFKDGLLKVHVPKDKNAKPKSVEVKVS